MSLLKVLPETLYLEDDLKTSFFPNSDGFFETNKLRHRNSYAVEGEEKDIKVASGSNSISGFYGGVASAGIGMHSAWAQGMI